MALLQLRMPNWCNNDLSVCGKKKDIQEFEEKALDNSKLSMNKLVPLPEALKNSRSPQTIVPSKSFEKKFVEAILKGEDKPITKKISEALIKKYGADDWYRWQVNNWGTKWDIEGELANTEIYGKKKNMKALYFTFDSAWSPPSDYIHKLIEMFPKLEFHLEFNEPGCAFKGEIEGKNGEIVNDYDTEMSPKDFHDLGYCDEEECKFDHSER